jgi:hypothetical protein
MHCAASETRASLRQGPYRISPRHGYKQDECHELHGGSSRHGARPHAAWRGVVEGVVAGWGPWGAAAVSAERMAVGVRLLALWAMASCGLVTAAPAPKGGGSCTSNIDCGVPSAAFSVVRGGRDRDMCSLVCPAVLSNKKTWPAGPGPELVCEGAAHHPPRFSSIPPSPPPLFNRVDMFSRCLQLRQDAGSLSGVCTQSKCSVR